MLTDDEEIKGIVTGRPARARRWFWIALTTSFLLRALLLPIPNVDNDFVFQSWSRTVTVDGFHTIYDVYVEEGNPSDECQYPPVYLYVLWLIGTCYRALFSTAFDPGTILFLVLLRLPTVFADLALGVILFRCLGKQWGSRVAHLGFAAYILSPALIWDSTIVTQIDSVQAIMMVCAVLLLASGRNTSAIVALSVAALTKHQAAVLAPLLLVVLVRRRAWRALAVGSAISAAIFALLALPFFLHGKMPELMRILTTPIGTAPYVSLNACNLWGLASRGRCWIPDAKLLLGVINCRHVGLAMFGAAMSLGLIRAYRDAGRSTIILAAAWICFSFFMLCTEMTERYVLVVLPFLLLLAPTAKAHAWQYALLSLTAFANLYLVFPLVAVTPWDAIHLPHSNFFYYLRPDVNSPLPVLSCWNKYGLATMYMVLATANLTLLAWLGWMVLPKSWTSTLSRIRTAQ